MKNKKTAVFGIYAAVAAADLATDNFVKSGFSAADASALLPDNLGSGLLATEKSTKAPEGATVHTNTGRSNGQELITKRRT